MRHCRVLQQRYYYTVMFQLASNTYILLTTTSNPSATRISDRLQEAVGVDHVTRRNGLRVQCLVITCLPGVPHHIAYLNIWTKVIERPYSTWWQLTSHNQLVSVVIKCWFLVRQVKIHASSNKLCPTQSHLVIEVIMNSSCLSIIQPVVVFLARLLNTDTFQAEEVLIYFFKCCLSRTKIAHFKAT